MTCLQHMQMQPALAPPSPSTGPTGLHSTEYVWELLWLPIGV